MGIDCSNCRCANREDEKILVIETNDKIINPKGDTRKEKLELEKVKSVKRPSQVIRIIRCALYEV